MRYIIAYAIALGFWIGLGFATIVVDHHLFDFIFFFENYSIWWLSLNLMLFGILILTRNQRSEEP